MTTSSARIVGFDSRTTTIAGVRLHDWVGGERSGMPVIRLLTGCGHFMIEERPQFVIDLARAATKDAS
jgi:hypothetical protein